MPDLGQELLDRFCSLLDQAVELELNEPTAMMLATVDAAGRPSSRVVLLRKWDQAGFVFFTNSHSRKGYEIAENPHVALCLYWDGLREQVRIEGHADRVSDEESDAYWRGRPRESQIGAWASDQSQPLDSQQVLTARVRHYEAEFANRDVPRPAHWIGYRVVPQRVEFWQNRAARLHERTLYDRSNGEWQKSILFP